MPTNIYNDAWGLIAAGKYEKARDICEPLAQEGDIDCMTLLAWGLIKRNGRTTNGLERARRWLEIPVAKEHAPAMYLSGMIFFKENDVENAVNMFECSGAAGYSAGYYQLSKMYQHGYGVQRDIRRAAAYRSKAAEGGHIFAQRDNAMYDLRAAKSLRQWLSAVIRFLNTIGRGVRVALVEPYSEKTFD